MSNALNIRHGLHPSTVTLFKMLADSRGMTHGEYLTELVRADAKVRKVALETALLIREEISHA